MTGVGAGEFSRPIRLKTIRLLLTSGKATSTPHIIIIIIIINIIITIIIIKKIIIFSWNVTISNKLIYVRHGSNVLLKGTLNSIANLLLAFSGPLLYILYCINIFCT